MNSKYQMLWREMEGHRVLYLLALAALVVSSCFQYLVPLVPQVVMDGVLSNDPSASSDWVTNVVDRWGGRDFLAGALWVPALIVVGLTLVAGCFTYLRGRWSVTAAERIACRIRDRLYDQLQHLTCGFYDGNETGDLVQRCTSDVETLRQFLASQVVEIGRAVILMLLPIPLMLALDVRMTIVSSALILPIVLFSVIFFRKVRDAFKEADEAEGAMTATLQENLTGIRVVRAFHRQEFEVDKFARANTTYRQLDFRLFRIMARFWSLSDLLCMAQLSLVIGFGAHWMAQGTLPVGTFYFFLAAVNLFLWPVRMMGRILTELGKATVAIGRIEDILGAGRELTPHEASQAAAESVRVAAGSGEAPSSDEGVSVPATAAVLDVPDSRSQVPVVADAWSTGAAVQPVAGFDQGSGRVAVPHADGAGGESGDGSEDAGVPSRHLARGKKPRQYGGVGHGFDEPGFSRRSIRDRAGELEFNDVSFSHGDLAVVRGVSFSVRPGETVAILGPSGAGKSTLIQLLLRLYDPDAGSIRLDGADIATLERKDVRSRVAVVMQEPFLYSKTIRENVRLGRWDAVDGEVEDATKAACVHESIEEFEDGYDTMVGERGVTLSGGQRQRTALARALLDHPSVLVLDDALSAVDTETESRILQALEERRGRETTIVIAHRLSTLMHADQILVLDQGRIVQRGTHQQLSEEDGLYRRLWEIQTSLEHDLEDDLEALTQGESENVGSRMV